MIYIFTNSQILSVQFDKFSQFVSICVTTTQNKMLNIFIT